MVLISGQAGKDISLEPSFHSKAESRIVNQPSITTGLITFKKCRKYVVFKIIINLIYLSVEQKR